VAFDRAVKLVRNGGCGGGTCRSMAENSRSIHKEVCPRGSFRTRKLLRSPTRSMQLERELLHDCRLSVPPIYLTTTTRTRGDRKRKLSAMDLVRFDPKKRRTVSMKGRCISLCLPQFWLASCFACVGRKKSGPLSLFERLCFPVETISIFKKILFGRIRP